MHQPRQHKAKSLACKKQLGALKMMRLDNSIAINSYIGQESVGPRESSRVVREQQPLVLQPHLEAAWAFHAPESNVGDSPRLGQYKGRP